MKSTIPQIFFTHDAINGMLAVAEKSKKAETGGLLLGQELQHDTGRAWVIDKITGPGRLARRRENGFSPDIKYYRKVRNRYPDLMYVGEWHKHPDDCPTWSLHDLEQARQILRNEGRFEILCPICCASECLDGVTRLTIRCFYLNRDLPSFVPLSYSVIDSPQDQRRDISYVAVEEDVVRKFLTTQRPYQLVDADIYHESGIAHVFNRPLRGNGSLLLVNTHLCESVDLPTHTSLAVAISQQQETSKVRGYYLQQQREYPVKTELVSLRADLLQRNAALLETKLLKNKHVVIIGLGSIGSVAALEMARAGVGKFTLIDPDTIGIHNLCRHICDLSELGMEKVTAVAKRIRRVLPDAKVRTYVEDSNRDPQQTLQYCSKADILLVATDTENSRRLANWIAHQHHIPVVFAGLLERAIGGRVWRVFPGKTACYECYPREQFPSRGTVAYSELQSPRDLTIQPGLGNDIAFITHLAVRYVFDSLYKTRQIPYHMVLWFNHARKKWQSQALTLYKIEHLPARSQCNICGNDRHPSIELELENTRR